MTPMLRILYVDDEAELLEIGRIFLESFGEFRVGTSVSAKESLDRGDLPEYDAIVSDYQMPVMDGIAFLKEVRSRYGNIPFILFTGKGREEVVIQAINEGADFYLQKGGDPRAQFAELRHKILQAVHRREAEQALRDSEKRLTDIINFLPDATFAIDREGRIIAWNRAIEEMTGIPAPAMLGKGDYEYALPFYQGRRKILIDLIFEPDGVIARDYTNIVREKGILIAEITLPRPGGKTVTLMGTASPLYDSQGAVVGAIESMRDITERKRAEDALKESEERYRNVVEDQTEFISRFYPDGTHVFVNDAYCRYFGLDRSATIGHRFRPMIHPEDVRQVRAFFASLTPDHPAGIIEHRIIMPDGSVRWQRWSDRAIFDASGRVREYQSVGRDITEGKEAEIRLQESEKRLSEIIEFAPNATYVVDRDRRIIVWNRAIEQMTGVPASAMLGRGDHAYAIPFYGDARPVLIDMIFEDAPGAASRYQNLRREGTTIIAETFCNALNNNAGAWVFVKTSPLRDASGRIAGAIESIRDISDIKNAGIALAQKNEELSAALSRLTAQEEELRRKYDELAESRGLLAASEERYRTLAEASRDFIFVVGRDDRVEYVNSYAAAILGLPASQIIGKQQSSLFPPALAERQKRGLQRIFETGKAAHSEGAMEFSGSTYWFDHYLMPITSPEGTVTAVLGVSRDISDRKRMETSLQESGERYRALFDAMHDCVAVYRAVDGGEDFVITEFNAAAERTERIGRDQVIGKRVTGVFPGVREFGILPVFRRVYESGIPEEYPVAMYRDNRIAGWRENYVYRLPGGEVVASYRDETEKKHAEEALRASEEKFRGIFNNINDAVHIHEVDDRGMPVRFIDANDVACSILQYSRDELLNLDTADFAPESGLLPLEDLNREILATGQAVFETVHARRDGTRFPVEIHARLANLNGMAVVISAIRDISARKKTLEALREIGEQYRSIFDSVSDGIVILDRDGRVAEANPAACAMHGYAREEVIGMDGTRFVHPRFHAMFAGFLATAPGEVFSAEALDIRRDGTAFPVTIRGRVFEFQGTSHVISIVTDLSGHSGHPGPGAGRRGEPGLITTDSSPL